MYNLMDARCFKIKRKLLCVLRNHKYFEKHLKKCLCNRNCNNFGIMICQMSNVTLITCCSMNRCNFARVNGNKSLALISANSKNTWI
ncbi:hypothetical protein T08_11993 [Trichinella sp. T8]|nr:hypothetical protein T08_11993 [Trichinella sp. T8]